MLGCLVFAIRSSPMKKIDLFQVSLHENLNSPDESEVADFLTPLLDQSDSLYAKKLSRNDRDWARFPNKHQNGIYVPAADRDGGFFPSLSLKVRDKPDADAIIEAFLDIEWPSIRVTRKARIVHFTSKGEETHLTRLPKQLLLRHLQPPYWLSAERMIGTRP